MSLDGWDDLRFLVTTSAAALLHGCARLPLAVEARKGEHGTCRLVLLATTGDDLDAAPAEAVPIAVMAEPPTGPCDARFVDVVFATATCSEVAFRARRAIDGRGTVAVHLAGDALEVGAARVPLSAIEQRLVERLLATPAVPVSRRDLEALLADADVSPTGRGRALDAHVYRLRRKLRGVPGIRIDTLRQRGFVLSLDAESRVAPRVR